MELRCTRSNFLNFRLTKKSKLKANIGKEIVNKMMDCFGQSRRVGANWRIKGGRQPIEEVDPGGAAKKIKVRLTAAKRGQPGRRKQPD